MKVQNNSFLALGTVQYPSKGSVIWVIPTISFDYLFKTIFLGNIFYFSDFYPSVLERFADCLLEVQTSYENVTRLNMLCRDILLLHFPVLLHLLNCQFSLSLLFQRWTRHSTSYPLSSYFYWWVGFIHPPMIHLPNKPGNYFSVYPARHADDLLLLNGGQDNLVSCVTKVWWLALVTFKPAST